ncbi:MAG TPA: preprotein translocase subunit SecG [Ignavibacteriaceae bacterium]|nr:preprotein translocase subunit SecG [Ignavibacteriaceae bacterium]
MFNVLLTVSSLVAIFLIIMVLLQASKGGGLAGTFGGGNVGAMFGTRRTADFLSKATWWLAGMLTLLALIANLFFLPGQGTNQRESIIQRSGRQTVPQSPSLPNQVPQQGQ